MDATFGAEWRGRPGMLDDEGLQSLPTRRRWDDLTFPEAKRPMPHQHIIVETKGRVGLIRLNRPQALNALNAALMAELAMRGRCVRGRRRASAAS